ncbi:CLUMA_CG019383, isoform A [Clunio marinus]|uniref:CLUMA_CG019383, isoform A n=1 Tax=Clunio marinus TaxID=568069 RepID=A0A1J1J2Q4_9DIPT|nr:CLUMA_CG019383, isoform A [Clunio marinus]
MSQTVMVENHKFLTDKTLLIRKSRNLHPPPTESDSRKYLLIQPSIRLQSPFVTSSTIVPSLIPLRSY